MSKRVDFCTGSRHDDVMRDLAEDLLEVQTEKAKRWVRGSRRKYGILPSEAATWIAEIAQARPHYDRHLINLGRSPADVILTAEMYAEANSATRRLGIGTWLMEVIGEEGVDPVYLIILPRLDEVAQ